MSVVGMATKIRMRAAVRDEVPDIVAMLADDMLGRARESSPGRPPEEYWRAFDDIAADPNNEILYRAAKRRHRWMLAADDHSGPLARRRPFL